jgi:hypothetical protein
MKEGKYNLLNLQQNQVKKDPPPLQGKNPKKYFPQLLASIYRTPYICTRLSKEGL